MKLMKLTPTYLAGTFLRCEFRSSQQQASTKISIASLLNPDEKATASVIEETIECMMKILFTVMFKPFPVPMHEHVYAYSHLCTGKGRLRAWRE